MTTVYTPAQPPIGLKKALLVGGFAMTIGDGDKYWKLAVMLTAAGFDVTVRQYDTLTTADMQQDWDVVIVYSWGCRKLWEVWCRLCGCTDFHQEPNPFKLKHIDLLVIIAGVPEAFEQGYDDSLMHERWFVPGSVDKAVCFQVDSVPASEPIRNDGTGWYNLASCVPETFHYVTDTFQADEMVNINCNGKGISHTTIKDSDAVQDAVMAFTRFVFPALSSGGDAKGGG